MLAEYNWLETHFVKFRPKRLKNALGSGFAVKKMYTIFYLSPLVSKLGRISDFAYRKELKYLSNRFKIGWILVCVAKKV
jgi:hypothetical protein